MGTSGFQQLFSALESQLFWGVIGLILAAIAISGKLSMGVSALLLVLAWGIGCIGIYRIEAIRDWYLMIALCLSLGATLAFLGAWLQPPLPISGKSETVVILRREQREVLASFFEKGRWMREAYVVPDDVSDAPAKRWSEEVTIYLENTFDRSYVVRFESTEGIPALFLPRTDVSDQNKKIHWYISTRLIRLDEFMKELRD